MWDLGPLQVVGVGHSSGHREKTCLQKASDMLGAVLYIPNSSSVFISSLCHPENHSLCYGRGEVCGPSWFVGEMMVDPFMRIKGNLEVLG